MQLDRLSNQQRTLWSRVNGLWEMLMTGDAAAVSLALHPEYRGWVTGQARPHGREAAIASVAPSSSRVLRYELQPLSVTVYDGVVGVVHYSYVAEVESGADASRTVAGRWSEVYLRKGGEWLLISVTGGPDGER